MSPHDPILAAWAAFYTITGSSAAALVGLMFVVITLISDRGRGHETTDGVSLFSTPTVIHFATALVVSAAMCAPWGSLLGPSVLLAVIGIFGGAYVARAMARTMNFRVYTPDPEDWFFYGIAPLAVYVLLLASGVAIAIAPELGTFVAAASVLVLIMIGIRNSWDVVTFIAITQRGTDPNVPKE